MRVDETLTSGRYRGLAIVVDTNLGSTFPSVRVNHAWERCDHAKVRVGAGRRVWISAGVLLAALHHVPP